MTEVYFKDPKEYILLEYQLRKNRRPAYSMRAFARDLQFSASSLNDFLKGRVGMSVDRINKLSVFLEWSAERKNHFQDLISAAFATESGERQAAQMRVKLRMKDKSSYFSEQKFNTISQWYHLVIVELSQIRDQLSPSDIARLIAITPTEARQAIQNLLKLGILHETTKGLKPTAETRQFGDAAPSDAINNFHSQILQQAQKSLFEKSMNERDNHSLVFTIRDVDREAMEKEIRKSLYNIVNKYAVNPNPDSVQIVSFHSFQMVKPDSINK